MKKPEGQRRFTGYATLNVLLPVELKERLKERAVREGLPVSRLVREALERYLAEKKER
jgi:predicted DNA-binding protein